MTFVSESDLPPSSPRMYDHQTDSHDSSLDSIDDNFDFDVNVDENHFSLPASVPTILVVKFQIYG